MTDYAVLLLPATNRVYNEAAVQLVTAELGVLNQGVLGGKLHAIRETRLGGVRCLRFSAEALEERDVRYLGMTSGLYALFQVAEEGLLRPVELRSPELFDQDLITIPKYQGKTNEHFTKLLLNVSVAASAFAPEMLDRKLYILDPLAGRGTTLNQALMYGWDCAGIEIDPREHEAYEQFLSTYLKRKRIKHKLLSSAIREGREVVGRRFEVEVGATRERFKSGETLRLAAICADTVAARTFFKAETFHAIVTDLPYGVRHGSQTDRSQVSRRPLDLLAAALPAWMPLLKPGGSLGLSWNRHVAGRQKVVEVVGAHGLEVLDSEPYRSFRHVVDQSILRDVLVARKGREDVTAHGDPHAADPAPR